MRSRNRNALIIELMLCVLFFALCISVLIRVFGAAHTIGNDAHNSMRAMHAASDRSEVIYVTEDAEALLAERGFCEKNGVWALTADEYRIEAEITDEAAPAGSLRTVMLTAYTGSGMIGEIEVTRYFPGEAAR